jgi:CubicO group peptidase (beta-lactamase class C family)
MIVKSTVLGMIALLASFAVGEPAEPEMTFPGSSWQETTPAAQGMDAAKLDDAMAYLASVSSGTSEAVVVRNGYLIWKGSSIDNVHQVWSVTKSFTSSVLGILISQGKTGLDELAKNHHGALASQYPTLTLRHLATMTSGYDAVGATYDGLDGSETPFVPTTPFFPPGSKFAYWDDAMNEYGNVLTQIADERIDELFKRVIADPIGMSGWWWGTNGSSGCCAVNNTSGNLAAGIHISARQIARFGHLFLNRGNWNGTQILSPSWVDQATSAQVPSSLPHSGLRPGDGPGVYGLNFWVNGIKPTGDRLMPDAPAGTFMALGKYDNLLLVVPEWNLVIARLGTSSELFNFGNLNTFFGQVGLAVDGGGSSCAIVNSNGCGTYGNGWYEGICDGGVYAGWKVVDGQWQECSSCSIVNSNGCGTYGSGWYEGICDGGVYTGWEVVNGQWLECSSPPPASGPARIAVSVDGNDHDCDDYTATPMSLAILAKTGNASKVVLYAYSDHIWSTATDGSCNGGNREEEMRISAEGTATRWGGFAPGIFYNARQQTAATVAALTAQINQSSAASPLWIIGAGPMEVIGRAVSASDPASRPYVTLVSHSQWNDEHAEQHGGGWTFNEIGGLGVNLHHITDQNPGLVTDPSQYFWLRDSSDPKLRWLWDRHVASGLPYFDPSDAGMLYWFATGAQSGGDENATPDKLRNLFGAATGGVSVVSLTLVNADSDTDLELLADGATLNLATLPTKALNIRANTSPGTVGSVRFTRNGVVVRTESVAPYTMAGDSGGNYEPWIPAPGSYTLVATPFTGAGASGTEGTSLSITFTVTN